MRKKIFLEWGGDGPESSNPGATATVEIDLADIVEESGDDDAEDSLEEALRAFGKDLQERFGADDFQTERMDKEIDDWIAQEEKKL